MSDSIEQKVKEIIVEQLGVGEDAVTPEASIMDDLGADSRPRRTCHELRAGVPWR